VKSASVIPDLCAFALKPVEGGICLQNFVPRGTKFCQGGLTF
jgi:hypothetical protein